MSALFVLFHTRMWDRKACTLHTSGFFHTKLESRCPPQDNSTSITFACLLCCYMISDSFSFLPCFGLSNSGFDSGQQALSGQLDHVLFSFAVIIIFYYKILHGLEVDPGPANAASLAFQVSSAVINKRVPVLHFDTPWRLGHREMVFLPNRV